MTSDFEKGLRALHLAKKLLALADRHPDTEEGRSARAKAEQLCEAHGLDLNRVDRAKGRVEFPRDKRITPGMFDSFARTVKKQYPGIDTEDYTKYGKAPKND